MSDPSAASQVAAHYSPDDLDARIETALHAAGKDLDALTPDDLAPFDQLHTGGKAATLALARLADLHPGTTVLDVGGGLGGPARSLAAAFGCQVTVLDLSEPFCRAGARLTARLGLTDRVAFRHGDALAIPFPDAAFDLVWTQHSSMNIPAKERLYAEIARVTRPAGRFVLHDVLAGPGGPLHFPVPWAKDPAISDLRPPDETRRLITDAGFTEVAWLDTTAAALEWYQQMAAPPSAAAAGIPPPGLHLLLGPDLPEMGRNLVRNLQEQRIVVVEARFDRA